MMDLKSRLRASAIHLAISLLVAALAALVVFGLWYPFPYRYISGGRELFLWLTLVDVVLGPLITLVIFNLRKTRGHLLIDFTAVGLLQLAALSYGLWTMFSARPVHLVFEYHRMAVVHAVDVPPDLLAKAPTDLQTLPLTGPTLLSLRPLQASEFVQKLESDPDCSKKVARPHTGGLCPFTSPTTSHPRRNGPSAQCVVGMPSRRPSAIPHMTLRGCGRGRNLRCKVAPILIAISACFIRA